MMVWQWFTEPFALGFQQRALLGGTLAGLMCAVVGTWLVLRGMSFFGDAFVHGVVPGIAAAVVLQINPALGAAVAAAVMVAGIEIISRQTRLTEDTAIGLLFVGMLALGVVIISSVDSYTGSLTTILFGDALGVTRQDLLGQAVLGGGVILVSIVMYRPFLALSFNRQKAELLGMFPGRAHAVLLVLIAAAVIGSFQSVGTLLVFGLLVGPPATAALVVKTVPRMMATAAALSVVSVWLGLLLSYHLGTAGSATMALVPIVGFFLTLAWTTVRAMWKTVPRKGAALLAGRGEEPPDEAVGMSPRHGVTGDGLGASLLAEATDVVLKYGSQTALAKSSFTIPPHGVTAVIGPNGSGKSTLLHALAGLVPVSEGRLQVLGRDAQQARNQISYVLQSTVVPPSTPITVREAVGMGRYPSVGFFRRFGRADHQRVAEVMRRMEIEDLAGRQLHDLSGGQRQRVYVAQGLAQEHNVLLLDEPLTGLDIVSARTIDQLIHHDGQEGGAVVLTTHDLDEARAADHVILVSGRVVSSGPPELVCDRHNVEVAFGLGGLHGWKGFLDDPAHDPHRNGTGETGQ